MKKEIRRFSIVAASVAAISTLIVTGFFAAILGVIILPFLLSSKKTVTQVPKAEKPKLKGNVIEADFSRVDKPKQ